MPIAVAAYMSSPDGATWRSGYATVCKTVYTGSIPVVASSPRFQFFLPVISIDWIDNRRSRTSLADVTKISRTRTSLPERAVAARSADCRLQPAAAHRKPGEDRRIRDAARGQWPALRHPAIGRIQLRSLVFSLSGATMSKSLCLHVAGIVQIVPIGLSGRAWLTVS